VRLILTHLRRLNQHGLPVLLDRFVANNPAGFELQYGTLAQFRAGLAGLLGEAVPSDGELLGAMAAEHCRAQDSDRVFEVHNYGTRTTSRAEFFFIADPSPERLASLQLKEWPQETKLLAANRPCRRPRPLRDFRAARLAVDAQLHARGESPLSVDHLVSLRLYTGPLYVKYNGVLHASIRIPP
jgi:hypothetical protein